MSRKHTEEWRPAVPGLQSYCHGASDIPLISDTIGDCLDRVASAHPDAEALVSCADGLRLTYRQLCVEVDRVAQGLIALGVQRHDRIGIWSGNCPQWVIAQFATAKVGGIFVGINPSLQSTELNSILRQTGVSVLIAARRYLVRDCIAIVDELVRESASTRENERPLLLKHIILLEAGSTPEWAIQWADLQKQGEDVRHTTLAERQAYCQCDDPALILFTSGSSGAAKAATLSHHSIVNSGFFIGERLKYTPADRICMPMPLHHSMGCIAGTIAAGVHGSTLVLPGLSFDPQSCLNAVHRERCTSLYGVPSMFVAQYQHPAFSRNQVASLRTGIIAGAPCASEIMMQVIDRMHMPEITTCYGLTETRCLFQSRRNDPVERRVATVGVIHPHVECKIVDPKTGQIVPRGISGELYARGYGTMLKYWNNDDATGRAIDSARWFRTGDLAIMSQDGYLSIVGRTKETIIRGGENVSPSEVEAVLKTCKKVVDACVVGVPDVDYGEELCAWVRLKESETATDQEIRRFCRQHLARHKVPRHVMFTDIFPLTATGKIQKYRLREMAIAALADPNEDPKEREGLKNTQSTALWEDRRL